MPDDRDRQTPKAGPLWARSKSQPVLAEVHDETSQAHDVGTDRDGYRARRGTDARVLRLEHRVDEQSERIAEIGADVALVKGGVDTLVRLQTAADEARRATEARELDAARAERATAALAESRRAALRRAIVLKVIAPIAAAIAAVLAAYKAGGG